MVFKAFTDKYLLEQWVGPKDMTVRFEKFEPRDGGSYRYVNATQDGMEFGFHGVVHEVTAPERIVQTFEFEGLPEKGHVVLETTRFEALGRGRTKVTTQSVFQSVQDRDGLVQSGMEKGAVESHDRLDDLIAKGIVQEANT